LLNLEDHLIINCPIDRAVFTPYTIALEGVVATMFLKYIMGGVKNQIGAIREGENQVRWEGCTAGTGNSITPPAQA
jgi:hypothetical protein